jgi:RNA polymerase sigma factor (sigma-70 family)
MEKPMLQSSSPDVSWSDTLLVGECLRGNEEAWDALVDKYKNLIYSIAIRRGFSPDDATDIFQSVAAQLLSQLTRLRQPEALSAWLIQVTSHQCVQWKRQQFRNADLAGGENGSANSEVENPESLLFEAWREQTLRQAIRQGSPQCRRLIEMLFIENPPCSYQDVAADLGIATGSIGFIRKKCLERLRLSLEQAGFR